ncbi:hypothetical protein [Rariglobus hedericola]|uniref:Uncharacterized protein n=1 Tax=Rariglobus hedericola TaxID=2597822 RepID=A0A556QGR8_9BACT|nr:hypothetical protein [Rariglobus hedericola]TSJ75830.1 hypothetical protein FPL22_16355 [Rariglobus hedericola]
MSLTISGPAPSASAATPSGPALTAQAGQPLTAFVEAFTAAIGDGLYATHFRPLVHPDLLAHTGDTWIFRDSPQKPSPADAPPTHVVRDLNEGELTRFATIFSYPVTPVKVLEFSHTHTDGASKTTSRMPLYLAGNNGAYTLVFGVPKPKEEVAAARAVESLLYYEDTGAWKQNWKLQMAASSQATYSVVLSDAAGENVIAVAGPWTLPEGRKTIRFMLKPEGASAAVRTTAQGKLELPYAWQAGASAASSHALLPLTTLTAYERVKTPAFTGDTLALASLTGIDDTGASRTLVLQLRRK